MIIIDNLTKQDVGRLVTYDDGAGDKEEGHITSWNDTYIFVDYGTSCGRGIATAPYDLEFSINFEGNKL